MVKRIRLVEEIHLISIDRAEPFEQTVALRRTDVSIERIGSDATDSSSVSTNTKGK